MPYEALARKWRPTRFADVAGQEHVVTALRHALESERLHHAYLFTGTRGVGKTTLARLFARCLNCEVGVTAEPCGSCSACTDIAAGRFIDLIEVDAASRTRVEDTRELLDNVQYAPSRGRFKIYLIDEVHMLSLSSFNALLKTLEEPPPHVKFLLATTDPRKLPITVLSRCLQFNLKNHLPEVIERRLATILEAEGLEAEAAALPLLARAAEGSMRDALSLLDQALAFGGGVLKRTAVADMLGATDTTVMRDLVQALVAQDAAKLLETAGRALEDAADPGALLKQLMTVAHEAAVRQQVETLTRAAGYPEAVALAMTLAAEDLQLLYQLAVIGLRDLPQAPDARAGLEMTLLRMLALQRDAPAVAPAGAGNASSDAPTAEPAVEPEAGGSAQDAGGPATARVDTPDPVASVSGSSDGHAGSAAGTPAQPPPAAAPGRLRAALDDGAVRSPSQGVQPDAARFAGAASAPEAAARPAPAAPAQAATAEHGAPDLDAALAAGDVAAETVAWAALIDSLPELVGVTRTLALHCAPETLAPEGCRLVLDRDYETLLAPVHLERLKRALGRHFSAPCDVTLEAGAPPVETPAAARARLRQEALTAARARLEQDAGVARLRELFDAQLIEASVEAVRADPFPDPAPGAPAAGDGADARPGDP